MRGVQICGNSPAILSTPRAPEGFERWILGAAYGALGNGPWDRIFDVHQPAHIHRHRPAALAWYAQQTRPVYLVEATPDIPASVTYPRQAVADLFGIRAASAMSSSIDQMMALALFEGFDAIDLVGVRMMSVEEWVTQREALAYWIGRAEAMGVDVETDPLSALCAPERVYGWDEPTGAYRRPGQPLPVGA